VKKDIGAGLENSNESCRAEYLGWSGSGIESGGGQDSMSLVRGGSGVAGKALGLILTLSNATCDYGNDDDDDNSLTICYPSP
jgi:hypothetical protein